MARRRSALVLALLCVLAVSVAAATVANPQSSSGDGVGSGDAAQTGDADFEPTAPDDGDGQGANTQGGPIESLGAACYPFLLSPEFQVGALFVLAGAVWGLGRRMKLRYATAFVGAFAVPAFVSLYVPFTACGDGNSSPVVGNFLPEVEAASAVDAGGQVGGDATNELLSTPVLLGLVVVVVAVAVAAVVYRSSGDDTADVEDVAEQEADEANDSDPVEDAEALSAIGAAAGDAADRIEAAADADNEVYRAWHDMTTHVDVPDSASSTPGEFAAAAESAGMAERDVDDLTDLFRAVRYGGQEATDDREQAAVDALRSIEAEYANGGGA